MRLSKPWRGQDWRDLCLPGGLQWLLVATVIWAGVTCAGISRQVPVTVLQVKVIFQESISHLQKRKSMFPPTSAPAETEGEKWPQQMSLFTAGFNNLVSQRGFQRVLPYKMGLEGSGYSRSVWRETEMVQNSPDSSDTTPLPVKTPDPSSPLDLHSQEVLWEINQKKTSMWTWSGEQRKGWFSSLTPDQAAESPTKGATGLISLIRYHRDKQEINSPTPQLRARHE